MEEICNALQQIGQGQINDQLILPRSTYSFFHTVLSTSTSTSTSTDWLTSSTMRILQQDKQNATYFLLFPLLLLYFTLLTLLYFTYLVSLQENRRTEEGTCGIKWNPRENARELNNVFLLSGLHVEIYRSTDHITLDEMNMLK